MESLAYQEEERTELLGGKIFYMSPRPAVNHNIVAGNIYRIFGNYLDGKSCTPFSDGVDVFLSDDDRVIPDVMVVCNKDIIQQDGVHGAPDLIVEVLSPSTAKNDKGYKKDLYAKFGVNEYWIVDTANRSVEIYLLKNGVYVLDDIYTVFPDFMLAKMTLESKSEIKTSFHPSLYHDLKITLSDIFKNLL